MSPVDWVLLDKGRSSHVAAIGFESLDAGQRFLREGDARQEVGTLYVAYKDASVYRFPRVTRQTFEAIVNADSVGRALNLLWPRYQARQVGSFDKELLP